MSQDNALYQSYKITPRPRGLYIINIMSSPDCEQTTKGEDIYDGNFISGAETEYQRTGLSSKACKEECRGEPTCSFWDHIPFGAILDRDGVRDICHLYSNQKEIWKSSANSSWGSICRGRSSGDGGFRENAHCTLGSLTDKNSPNILHF